MVLSSHCRRPLRGTAIQNVAWKRTKENSWQSPSDFRRFTWLNSPSTPSKADFGISTPLSTNPKAILALDVPTPPALNFVSPAPGLAPAPPPAPTDNLFRQFMQAYIEDRHQLAQALTLALVESQKNTLDRPLKS